MLLANRTVAAEIGVPKGKRSQKHSSIEFTTSPM